MTPASLSGRKILLIVGGGIAAYKVLDLCRLIRRKGLLVPLTEVTPPEAGETVETAQVRFRTVGDMTCTCPVESPAANATEIVAETLQVTVSERGATRMDDRTSEASMERRKKEGYF
jgi:sulfate adenylyltransferase subunit 2